MKRKNLLLNFWLTLLLFGVISSPTVFGQSATLTHSYTFEDGTANDTVGTANGVLQGDASVANGALTLSGNQRRSLAWGSTTRLRRSCLSPALAGCRRRPWQPLEHRFQRMRHQPCPEVHGSAFDGSHPST